MQKTPVSTAYLSNTSGIKITNFLASKNLGIEFGNILMLILNG